MFVLYETPAGYAIFKVINEKLQCLRNMPIFNLSKIFSIINTQIHPYLASGWEKVERSWKSLPGIRYSGKCQ